MRPHEEERRRVEDQTLVARVGFSPWTNIAHLAGTATIIVALITFGGKIYGTQLTLSQASTVHSQDIRALEISISRHDRELSGLRERVTGNTRQIDRVEKQAADNRDHIISRLDRLSTQMRELNRHLRGDTK